MSGKSKRLRRRRALLSYRRRSLLPWPEACTGGRRHQKLLGDRIFDDVLMREGIATHYLPLGPRGEKGIDVWLALEACELAIYKRFNVLVLIACDSDCIPLVRKVNTLGTRVMVVGWDFEYIDHQ